ncbi:MAG TPA: PEP/pyruvate-binding domain-containing protein [Chloroflexota bacterium]|nr:PEP/pyruvate-binding domain-containing protein [Chloroflexota bacterium]
MVTVAPSDTVIRWLDQAGDSAASAVLGGKAAPLARLTAAGFAVPPGFVITPEAFADAPPAGTSAAPTPDAADAPALAAEVQSQIREAYTALARRLGESDPAVAVRSSATAEDLADASFAGQYETYLGVRGADDVVRAAARCWVSLWTPHAVAYRTRAEEKARAAGRELPAPRMAVLVQALIPAEAAGVAFTADPVTGDTAAVTINAAWGLGQSVVDGEVEADTWKIDRRTREVLVQTTGHKPTRTGLGEGSDRVAVPPELQDRPSLTPEQAAAVADLALRAEERIGGPADVEWAVAAGWAGGGTEAKGLWLLQARPITTGVADAAPAPAEQPVTPPAPSGPTSTFPFSWAEVAGQGVPDPAGYTWRHQPRPSESSGVFSALRPLRQDGTRAFFRSFTNSATIKGQDRIGRATVINGQLYTTQVPGPGTDVERAARKAAFERPANALVERGETYLQTVVFPEVDENNARLGAVDPFSLAPGELAAHFEECLSWYERAWTLHWLWGPDSPSQRFTKLYAEVTGAALTDEGKPTEQTQAAAAELLTHEPNLFTEAVDGLTRVARVAQRHLGVRDVLMTRSASEALAALRDPAAPDGPEGAAEFRDAFEELLARQGLRCGSGFGTETDEMPPSWREDPTVVIELVKRYAVQDLDAVEAARRAAIAARDRRTEELRASISDPEKRRQFDYWLDAARRGQQGFEDHNYKIDSAASSLLHLAITACGRRLADSGVLDAAEDVWWLHAPQVTAALRGLEAPAAAPAAAPVPEQTRAPGAGGSDGAGAATDAAPKPVDWRALVAAHQALHRWQESLTPPKTLGAPPEDKTPEEKKPDRPAAEKPAPPPNVLVTGQTGSAGSATGRVRLANKNALVPDVEPGDVLVAHNAGPLWTPVFPAVAAVVLDEGVLFQHAMLTCREYGIPAIFQTKEGSKLLKEGQRVTVDATNGWVLPAE